MSNIFEEVNKTAKLLGVDDAHWLKTQTAPKFDTVEIGGQGPEMILLHGLFGALSNWDSSQPLFSKFSKPVALRFPIIGGHRTEVKVKALSLYTEYYIRQQKIAPVTVCGNSLGGHVALRLCLSSPQLVDCLILTGTSGLYEHTVDALPVRPDYSFIRDQMSRVFFDQKYVTDPAIEDILSIIKSRANSLNIIHAARSAKKDNLEKLLPQIKVPTLLLWGEDDLVTTMKVAKQFHKLIPNSELITIKGCGHAPMIEKPEWFSGHVERFVKQHSRFYKK